MSYKGCHNLRALSQRNLEMLDWLFGATRVEHVPMNDGHPRPVIAPPPLRDRVTPPHQEGHGQRKKIMRLIERGYSDLVIASMYDVSLGLVASMRARVQK